MAGRSFFVDPKSIQGERAELRGQVAHQIKNVLRLRPGDAIELLDNSGFLYVARIAEISKEVVAADVVERRQPASEPGVGLELYQALLKGQKMELVLQKGTEIGVSRFVPVLSERCVSRPSAADMERRLERWGTIVREAAEQSGRAVIPAVAPLLPFQEACRDAGDADLAVMAWEEEHGLGIGTAIREAGLAGGGPHPRPLSDAERGASASTAPPSPTVSPLPDSGRGAGGVRSAPGAGGLGAKPRIALLVGPEGGFSPREAELARDAGFRVASLGPRILRAETAALVAATLVLCETGDLGG